MIAQGIDAASNAITAPAIPRRSHPTPVQKARRLVPGVSRASAKQSEKSSLLIHLFLLRSSRCRTATVALPPPKVKLAYRAKVFAISAKPGLVRVVWSAMSDISSYDGRTNERTDYDDSSSRPTLPVVAGTGAARMTAFRHAFRTSDRRAGRRPESPHARSTSCSYS